MYVDVYDAKSGRVWFNIPPVDLEFGEELYQMAYSTWLYAPQSSEDSKGRDEIWQASPFGF